MPFVMAPNLFGKFNNSKTKFSPQERFHNDGIIHNIDSPEAFDEIFFSSFKEDEIKSELKKFINLVLLKYNSFLGSWINDTMRPISTQIA